MRRWTVVRLFVALVMVAGSSAPASAQFPPPPPPGPPPLPPPIAFPPAWYPKLDPLLQPRASLLTGQSLVIVRAVNTASLAAVATLIQQTGGTLGRPLSIIDGRAARVPNASLPALASSALVQHLSLDRGILAAMERTGATIGATAVRQEFGYDGSGVSVAVIDSGATSWHDDLGDAVGVQRVDQFVDFVNGQTASYDDYGHGTHVAGIIAGNGFDSNGARSGIAPAARLIVLKTLDGSGRGHISDVIAGLDYVVNHKDALNIRVVNMSVATGVSESYTVDPLTLAAQRTVAAGIVVVAAAGNNGNDSQGRRVYGSVGAPGNAPWVLTVGASSHMGTADRTDDTMAAFSSRGPSAVDNAAKPDVVAPGVGIESLSDPNSSFYVTKAAYLLSGTAQTSYLPYLSLTGTSMAAPVVSGTVALMLQANPALTPNQIKAILQYTAQVYEGYDRLTEGAGFLNAEGAVALARYFAAPSGTAYPTSPDWSGQVIWGNQLFQGGRFTTDANAWSANVTWGVSTTPGGESVEWGLICPTSDCDGGGGTWNAWATTATSQNVVWGSACDGADCQGTWSPGGSGGTVGATSDDGDGVVWGTTDGDGVVWGTTDGDGVVWGTNLYRRQLSIGGLAAAVMQMRAWLASVPFGRTAVLKRREADVGASRQDDLSWHALPRAAQIYVATIVAAGVSVLIWFFPTTYPRPLLFAVLVFASCLISIWKVNLPIALASGATLSVSHAVDLMSLLLLGTPHAMLIAVAGAWVQCTVKVKQRYPLYRTVFSAAAEAITMAAAGLAYVWLGGSTGPFDFSTLAQPFVVAMATYFVVNTGLVSVVIALTTDRSVWTVWRDDFLWSGISFMVASSAGALGAVVIERGEHWQAVLLLAPVYLTYRTYELFVGRLEDQKRHLDETRRLHMETVDALLQARQAERALTNEKERLAVTLRSIGDAVITTDLDGLIGSINNAAEALTGWPHEEAVGKPLVEVFRNFDPETRERCDNSVEKLVSEPGALEVGRRCTILAARDLTEHPIEESTALIRNAEGRTIGIVLAFRDITDALRIQEERAKASKLASLGLLAGGMAHDFNNILMAVMGNVSMARATMPRVGSAASWLTEAEQACVRARQLTWQLLTFSKGGVPARKTVEIAPILQEATGLVLRGSSVGCTSDVPPDLWQVDADASQLVQVFSNVITNARQAMLHNGSIAIRVENVCEIDRRWENALRVEPGRYVRVSITDKGIGIPKEHLSRIFDPYFSTKQRGSGLGLATTYAIVKNHGGFVAVDSQLGRGTTIHLNFPAAASRSFADQPDSARRVDGGRHRVLIMDDEASIRTLTANMLEFLGYDAEVTDGGAAAVERFQRAQATGRPFDVVLLDLVVPGDMGGTEAMDRLGGIDSGVKAILMSGFAQDSVATEFLSYGFSAVIEKPFTLRELSATLHSVIGEPAARVH